MILCVSAPVRAIRLPPPPGFVPPLTSSPSVISVSVLNPFSAPNYKINTLQTCNTTKSILREPGYSVKNVSDRVVSFDLDNSTTKNNLKQAPTASLPSKRSNPSMPNLHYYGSSRRCSNKNPFLADDNAATVIDNTFFV